MNLVMKAGNEAVDFEVEEGSHVFLKRGNQEHYLEWNELTPEQQEQAKELRDSLTRLISESTRELEESLKHSKEHSSAVAAAISPVVLS
ncbi:MAG: hypothetical protein M0Z59_05805 [Nitrospiraceae bacterium]|nr:hypothetical protein [Nitrospiraceae bacterium]